MKTPFKIAVLALFAISGGYSQSSPSSDSEPSVADIAQEFPSYQKITKELVYVNPILAMLCRGATKDEVEAARIKYGPHANTGILIYMNESAAEAFNTHNAKYPVGAVVVKQKQIHGYTDSEGKRVREVANGVGGMIKRAPGYDPSNGDWEYFYFDDAKKIESGRIQSCVQCHAQAKDRDFVFGNWSRYHD